MELRERVVARPLRPSATPDGVLADLVVSAPGGTTVSVPLTAATAGSTTGTNGVTVSSLATSALSAE